MPYAARVEEMPALVYVAEGFDPTADLQSFASEVKRTGDDVYEVAFFSALHGLAFANASGRDQVLGISGKHPVDADGWADWSQAAPGESEMTSPLLPAAGIQSDGVAYRYEDAWVWDPSAPPVDASLLESLRLTELAEAPRTIAQGRGRWMPTAIKIAWKAAGRLNDPRVQAALRITQRGWEKLREQSYEQRARWEQHEFERRLLIDLAETRRERLETGSASSRRKARQYYSTLDALIAANQ